MKKTFLLILINLFVALNLIAQNKDLKTFTTKSYSVQYPKNWEFSSDKINKNFSTFMIKSPLENTLDTFQENINLAFEDLSKYNSKIDLDIYIVSAKANILKMLPDIKILTENKGILSKYDSYNIEYTGTYESYKLKWRQVIILKNKKVYILSYTANEDNFNDFYNITDDIIKSFVLK